MARLGVREAEILTTPHSARLIRVDAADNVAILAAPGGLPAGTELEGLTLGDRVPEGHKIALEPIPEGAPIRRYGVVIGHASEAIAPGGWVHESRMRLPAAPMLQDLPMGGAGVSAAPVTGLSFKGFRNEDGSVGTRNLLGITTTVQCVAGIVEHAAARIRSELLPRYPNVDDVMALDHSTGCGVAISAPGAEIPIRTLRNIARNPNFGGAVLAVSLGCEKMQPDLLFPGEAPDLVRLQDETGFEASVRQIMTQAEAHLERLSARQRQTCPASDLTIALQCGGSDAFSGVTANPALGLASDRLVAAGAKVIFSETTEVRDGIAQLTARAASPAVARSLMDEMAWYDAYLALRGADRAANTTPGNKAGGLTNIVEKAMGSIIKSGSAPISGVIAPGARAEAAGLNFLSGPASDFVCGTLMLAAGANLQVFTTGRGTPYSLAALPTLKVATRSGLAARWHDLIDMDAGPVATGEATLEAMGEAMVDAILATASGQPTKAEALGCHNPLALFAPGAVT